MNRSLNRYTIFKAHDTEVRQMVFEEEGILSISFDSISFTSRTGVPIVRLRFSFLFFFFFHPSFPFLFINHLFIIFKKMIIKLNNKIDHLKETYNQLFIVEMVQNILLVVKKIHV